jgi:hypothetical protein
MVFSSKGVSNKVLMSLVLALSLLLMAACGGKKEPSRWDNAQNGGKTTSSSSTSTGTGTAVAPKQDKPDNKIPDKTAPGAIKPLDGGTFNKFFPPAGDGYDRVAVQEKEGTAIYKLKKGGKDAAELSVTDTANNPSAVEKFKSSSQKIGGYPAVDQGSTATAVLVANRFQVKAISKDPSFSKADREKWLGKFNLSGLSALK